MTMSMAMARHILISGTLQNGYTRCRLDGWAADVESGKCLACGESVATPPAPPKIVCLCGSTRFYDEFQQVNYDRTMAGEIVLSVGFYPHAKTEHGHGEGVEHDSAEKVALDELHKRKIDLCDYVLVIDVDGYIGESTRSEIEYAEQIARPVVYLSGFAG